MSIVTSRFVRKPFFVNAIPVTSENMSDIAEWCKGRVMKTTPKPEDGVRPVPYIKVDVKHAQNEKQTRAFVGDYVLQSGSVFKVYTETAFMNSFEPSDTPVKT